MTVGSGELEINLDVVWAPDWHYLFVGTGHSKGHLIKDNWVAA